ncbi:MAG: hypothetical protein EBR82_31470 [Caulobacteraceae bacterium]|nr:hypothetical protein [Caulobacteraceae bacterium]
MAGSSDIVFMIGADVTGLTAAGQRGGQSLAEMEKAAKDLERQITKIGQAGVDFQNKVNSLTGVTREFSNSAKASAAAFEAFDRSKAQVESLRASIDPLYAATKRYEAALAQLDAALDTGAISLAEHTATVAKVKAAYLEADTAGTALSGGFTKGAGNAKMFMQQLSQVAQQGAATGQWAQAFTIQLADIGGAFGPIGLAVGALATVGLPLLIGALSNTGTSAKDLKEAQTNLNSALSDYKSYADIAMQSTDQLSEKYGIFADQVRSEAIYMAQIKLADAFSNLRTVIAANSSELDNVLSLTQQIAQVQAANVTNSQASLDVVAQLTQELTDATAELGLSAEQAAQLKTALDAALNAQTAQDMATSVGAVLALLQQFAPEGTKASESVRSIADAFKDVADQARIAATASAQVAASAAGMDTGNPNALTGMSGDQLVPGATKPTATTRTGTRAGGGGSRVNALQSRFEQLQSSLMTEEQAEMASYQRRQLLLEQALKAGLTTRQQYAAMALELQTQHQEAMAKIDVWRYGTNEQKFTQYMDDMATALQSGNERMQAIGKKFAAAEALVNAWRAFSQTLADPTLLWWQKIPAATAALASGMSAVQALGGSSSSKSSSTKTTSTSTAAATPANVNITWNGAMTQTSLATLFSDLNKGYSQGYRLNFV